MSALLISWIPVVAAIFAIWLLLLIWVKVNASHQKAMADVMDCRLRVGCLGCQQQNCSERETETVYESGQKEDAVL